MSLLLTNARFVFLFLQELKIRMEEYEDKMLVQERLNKQQAEVIAKLTQVFPFIMQHSWNQHAYTTDGYFCTVANFVMPLLRQFYQKCTLPNNEQWVECIYSFSTLFLPNTVETGISSDICLAGAISSSDM